MTLDEAIEHAYEVAKMTGRQCSSKSQSCSIEHLQLAEWLTELKKYKDEAQQTVIDRLSKKLHKYMFSLYVECNDNNCMYQSKKETFVVIAASELDAYNMMIENCLNEGYQRFFVESLIAE